MSYRSSKFDFSRPGCPGIPKPLKFACGYLGPHSKPPRLLRNTLNLPSDAAAVAHGQLWFAPCAAHVASGCLNLHHKAADPHHKAAEGVHGASIDTPGGFIVWIRAFRGNMYGFRDNRRCPVATWARSSKIDINSPGCPGIPKPPKLLRNTFNLPSDTAGVALGNFDLPHDVAHVAVRLRFQRAVRGFLENSVFQMKSREAL